MVRKYFLAMYFLLGSLILSAQNPCSDFNDASNPAGNWAPAPAPNGNVSIGFGSPNPLDGTQYLILKDLSGGSWYQNDTDFKSLGKEHLGQCLYFDFYIENDSGYNQPYHPNITLSDGTNSATFVANVTVTPGSGWVRVKAPIQLANGGPLPSNSDGAWTMNPVDPVAFDNIIMNTATIGISPDMTSTQQEVVYFDNICVKPCEGCNECNSNFKFQSTTSTSGNYTIGQVFLESSNSPGMYKVDWGDGVTSDVLTSHIYANPGSYKVCVTQYEGDKPKCSTCIVICIPKPSEPGQTGKTAYNNLVSPLKENASIARAELEGINGTKEYFLVPNPASNYVDVQTNLSKKGSVSIRIVDASGKVVAEKSETVDKGRQSIKVNTEKLIQGMYIVEVKVEGKTSSQKLLISK